MNTEDPSAGYLGGGIGNQPKQRRDHDLRLDQPVPAGFLFRYHTAVRCTVSVA